MPIKNLSCFFLNTSKLCFKCFLSIKTAVGNRQQILSKFIPNFKSFSIVSITTE